MFKLYLERFRRNKLAVAGFTVIACLTVIAIFAPHLSRQDPIAQDLTQRLQGPSALHWLGTDDLGRDVFARLLFGTRVSLSVGLVAVGLAPAGGASPGPAGGVFGWCDGTAGLSGAAGGIFVSP